MTFDYDIAFSRMNGLVDEAARRKIRETTVGIAGLGGCGSNHLLSLVRMGFERFTLADPDTFELANFNRQAGATMNTIGVSKVTAMAEMARAINPNCSIETFEEGLTSDNIADFVRTADIGINAIDWFRIDLYQKFHDTFRSNGKISLVGGVPFSYGASISAIGPETESFNDVFGIDENDATRTKLELFTSKMASAKFAARYLSQGVNAIAPIIEETKISSISPGLSLATAMTCTEIMAAVTGSRTPTFAPRVLQIDLLARAIEYS